MKPESPDNPFGEIQDGHDNRRDYYAKIVKKDYMRTMRKSISFQKEKTTRRKRLLSDDYTDNR